MATMYWFRDDIAPDRYHLHFRQRAKKISGSGTLWFRPEVNSKSPYQASVYLATFDKDWQGYKNACSDRQFFSNWRDAEKWAAARYNEMLQAYLGGRP